MNKSVIMRTFNQKFQEFLDDIISIFPEQRELQLGKNLFNTLKSSNPSLLIKIWHTNVYVPYGEEIEKGNIDFFLTKDYSDDLTNVKKNQEIIGLIENLKESLRNMDSLNKEHSNNHLKLLSNLSVLYLSSSSS